MRDRFYKYDEFSGKLLSVSRDGVVHTFALYGKKKLDKILIQDGAHVYR